MSDAARSFDRFFDIVRTLRSPEGCPWDREQTVDTLKGFLLEESFECIDAIDAQDDDGIKEELGDVLLIAIMIAYVKEEQSVFSTRDVLDEISDKLVRRHPHVFGEAEVQDSAEVKKQWDQIKIEVEGKKKKESLLDSVPQSFPPLERAFKMQKKAAKAGFDWPDIDGVFKKIEEESAEVKETIADGNEAKAGALEDEIGDLLFSVINLARYLRVDPSLALNRTNRKFAARFRHVEQEMKARALSMEQHNLDVMDQIWEAAKRLDA